MKKKIFVYAEDGWAVGRIHRDLEKYLSDEFEFTHVNWSDQNLIHEHFEKFDQYDIFLSLMAGYHTVFLWMPNINLRKCLFISHGFEEFTVNMRSEALHGMTSRSIAHLFPSYITPLFTPNGVELDNFTYKEHSGNVNNIGWCARPSIWFKQFEWAQQIAKKLNTPLHIPSKCPMQQPKDWIALSHDQLKIWYSRLDILLVTSIPNYQSETGPLPAFEAIASGVLVIGTAVGNFAEIPGPKFSTIDEAVSIIEELRTNPEKVKQLAKEQYDCVVEKWCYKVTSKYWRDSFNAVIKNNLDYRPLTSEMKPTLLFYEDPSSAVHKVHKSLEPYLEKHYNIIYHDWKWTDGVFYEKEKQSDVVITGLDGYFYLRNFRGIEGFKKYVCISHGYPEFYSDIPANGLLYGMTSKSIRHLFPSESDISLVPNGVNHNLFDYVERNGTINTLGWCGKEDVATKRVEMAHKIANILDLPMKKALNENMKDWYQSIDIFLITAGPELWHETGPLTAFEAIVSGVLVIGTRVGNFAEIPGPKFSTVEEAVDIINNLKQNPEEVVRLAKEQYKCVMESWTFENTYIHWKNLIDRSLQTNKIIKKKVFVFGPIGWSVERVHRDIERYLTDDFEFTYFDWRTTDFLTIADISNQYDICVTQIATINFFITNHVKVDFSKWFVVAHGGSEFTNVVLPDIKINYGMTSYEISHLFPPSESVFLVRNGVEPDHFEYKERQGNIQRLGWCGDVNIPTKNYSLATKISETVNIPLDTAMNFTFPEMKTWYHSIDILLVTAGPDSSVETGPLPAFEAIVSGVLVIGRRVGNFSKIPGPKFSTLDEAVAIINKLKEDPKEIVRLARQQYECVINFWTYKDISNEWRSAFNTILSKVAL
jgi:glycosyltransferase involved in cell wall biosynthesis